MINQIEWEIIEIPESYTIKDVRSGTSFCFSNEQEASIQILSLWSKIQDRKYYKNPNSCSECGTVLGPQESTCPKCENLVTGS